MKYYYTITKDKAEFIIVFEVTKYHYSETVSRNAKRIHLYQLMGYKL